MVFIDEVANYREYDAANQSVNGKYATMFEEEYEDIIGSMQLAIGEDEYIKYLQSISAARTHAGYFSVDGKGKMVNSKVRRKETTSDDVSAYELIMKNKELLLERDPVRSPVRFIFSHSALREGWDNPNVSDMHFEAKWQRCPKASGSRAWPAPLCQSKRGADGYQRPWQRCT